MARWVECAWPPETLTSVVAASAITCASTMAPKTAVGRLAACCEVVLEFILSGPISSAEALSETLSRAKSSVATMADASDAPVAVELVQSLVENSASLGPRLRVTDHTSCKSAGMVRCNSEPLWLRVCGVRNSGASAGLG